jgi:hypothetical protein
MNIKLDAETLAKINAQLEQEREAKPDSPLGKALEYAQEIRENILAIKGETYLKAIDFGLIINKAVHINAAISQMIIDTDPRAAVTVTVAGHAHSSMMASLLSDYCEALGVHENSEEFAKEMTDWIDRVFDAEQAGVKQLFSR